jgi:hypothetical protein
MVRKLECKRPVSVPGQQLSGPQHQANCAASLPIPRVNRLLRGSSGCRARRDWAKANADGSTTVEGHPIRRGTADGTERRMSRLKQGISGPWPQGKDPTAKNISRRERARASDEAIVSDDPAGQHNPLASQGPLDRSVRGNPARLHSAGGPTGASGPSELWSRISNRPDERVRRSRREDRFEAVLGKTRRTEF